MVSRVFSLNIKDESTETNYPTNTLRESAALFPNYVATCSKNLILQEAFKTAAQMKRNVKKNGIPCKEFKLLIDRFSSFFSLNVENR